MSSRPTSAEGSSWIFWHRGFSQKNAGFLPSLFSCSSMICSYPQNYLEDRGPDLRAELREHAVALEGLDDDILEVVDLLHLDLNLRFKNFGIKTQKVIYN